MSKVGGRGRQTAGGQSTEGSYVPGNGGHGEGRPVKRMDGWVGKMDERMDG